MENQSDSEHQPSFDNQPSPANPKANGPSAANRSSELVESSGQKTPASLPSYQVTESQILGGDLSAGQGVQISDGFLQLDPRNIQVSKIAGMIFSGIFTLACLIGLLVLGAFIGFDVFWLSIASIAMGLVALSWISAFLWPAVEHRHASWRLDAEGFEIRRGVFWRHRITIPLGRVQHADVSQGPLQRMYEIGTLTVHTAGTSNASVVLEGLAHSNALQLRDLIVRQRKDQHVV